MNTTQEQLQALRANLDRLLRSFQAVGAENEMLKQQVDAQRRGLADKNKRIEEMEKQFEMVKTAQTIAAIGTSEESPETKAEVKKRINELIKEVDNCIAMLND
jgi:predicted  nucleic acid-binding Zn-ribbon protein